MTEAMLAAYRHDAHKFRGESHRNASESLAGVPVNQPVPEGADGDAAALSRPPNIHEPTVPNHNDHYRLSLFTGASAYDPHTFSRATIEGDVADLLTVSEAGTAHKRWLATDVASGFNESVYHPYTSLKYHTLLVGALLHTYRSGHAFEDLRLVVDPPEGIVPFRTIYDGERFALRIDADADSNVNADVNGRPAAPLGSQPWRSWATTWTRLTAHPLKTDHDKYDMTLDANLRRIQSWSTALQYLEDFAAWRPDR